MSLFAQTRIDLDSIQCNEPGCSCPVVALTADCHPDEGLSATYEKATGRLMIWCATCGQLVERIQVAQWPAFSRQ